jgi:hypothetical protein
MDNDAIDFSELNPNDDPQRFELAIDRITAAAAPILARRRVQGSVWWQLTAWRKPVFAMGIAATLLLFGVAGFGTIPDEEDVPMTDDLSLALGVPAAMTEWATSETPLSAAQVLYPGEDE